MKIGDLNNKLDSYMKDYIRNEGYVDSGMLLKSIKFKSVEENNELIIKFDAEDYIQYLNDGNFINDFFSQNKVLELITEYRAEMIDIQIQNELDSME